MAEDGARSTRTGSGAGPAPWRRLLREPLLHFLVLGAALFALEANTRRDAPSREVIVVSEDFVRALSRRTESTTHADREALVRSFVRDEALYREAKRLGLDRGDAIVRRRLIQKMEFLLRGMADVAEPTDEELQRFLSAHAAEFETPARVWFEERFFASGHEDPMTRAAAARQALVSGGTADGDPNPGGLGGRGLTRTQLATRRSPALASVAFGLEPGRWSEPFADAVGAHLVRVTRREPARPAELDAVRARVRQAYLEGARERAFERAAERVMARYRVEREGDSTGGGSP